MTTESTSANGDQASTSGLPQAGTSTTDGQAPVSQTTSSDHERIISELRKENAAARKRLEAFETAHKEAERAKLGETERLNQQYAELQEQHETIAAELAEARVEQAVARQAAKLNFSISSDLITRLLDWDEIEFDGGKPTNIDKLLERLAKASPELIRSDRVQSSGGATNPSRTATSSNGALSWDVITKMTAEQYNARRPEIQAWMARNPMKMI